MLSLLYHGVKIQQHFVNASCMFLANKTLPTIWLNPGSNLTIFQGTGPALFIFHFSGRNTCQSHLSQGIINDTGSCFAIPEEPGIFKRIS